MTILKLQERFPEKFTESEAIDIDIVGERRILEEQTVQITITIDFVKLAGRPPVMGDIHQGKQWTVEHGVGQWNVQEICIFHKGVSSQSNRG